MLFFPALCSTKKGLKELLHAALKWFAWAYQDETTATKNHGTDPDRPFDDYLEGGKVNPNRRIDALMGVQVNLEVCF